MDVLTGAFNMSCVSNMDVPSSVVYFYPRVIPLHNIYNEETVMLGPSK